MVKKILLSGIQPSGRPHIGNYFGMMRQLLKMQKECESYVLIVDYHALTSLKNPKELSSNIIEISLDYLALGLDPKTATIFKQSDVPEHAELAWIFSCITTMPYLMRAHAFKDAEAKNKEINVGVFEYPLLMAADMLLYDTDIVPVGADQKQHVEITRDTAEKFNLTFGETFKLPEPHILENVKIIPGTDGRKMSKSYGNTIPLFATDEEIEKAVMGIVTDSSSGVPKNVYEIHKLFRSETELAELYQNKAGKYKELKETLIQDIKSFISPLREKRKSFEKNRSEIADILKEGGKRARLKAEAKMETVKRAIGVR